MSVIRAFIAIDLSSEIYRRLEQVTGDLQQSLPNLPVRWVAVENIHLTLKFLGDVSIANLDLLKKLLESEANCHPAFELSVGELGAFPSVRRPRVIWVGIEAPQELMAIQRGIEEETARLGYAREDREFSPHLTLGRVSRSATAEDVRRIGDVLCKYKVGYLGATRVRSVQLYRSDLQPGGAVYTQLFSAALSSP